MSKPYSARGLWVASAPRRKFFEKALRCFLEVLKSEGPDQMQISKEQGRSFALSTTGEVCGLCGGRKFYFVDAAPLSFSFEILHLAVVTPIGCA